MTYLGDEIAHRMPIELYQFNINGVFWNWTDSEIAFVHPVTGTTYLPEPISHGSIQSGEENSSMSLDITVDALNPAADFFRTPFLPARLVWVLIERTHIGSTDAPAIAFRGTVAQCVMSGATAKLTAIPTRQAITRSIPSVLVSQLCSNALYDLRCLVDRPSFTHAAVITAVSGVILTVSGLAQPDGYYNGGILMANGHPSASIRIHEGGTLTLLYNYGYTVGLAVSVAPGCDKRKTTCRDKFNNVTHYQGFADLPVIDPFTDNVS